MTTARHGTLGGQRERTTRSRRVWGPGQVSASAGSAPRRARGCLPCRACLAWIASPPGTKHQPFPPPPRALALKAVEGEARAWTDSLAHRHAPVATCVVPWARAWARVTSDDAPSPPPLRGARRATTHARDAAALPRRPRTTTHWFLFPSRSRPARVRRIAYYQARAPHRTAHCPCPFV